MLGGRFQDAAAENVREQLVSGLLKRGGSGQLAGFRTVFGHAGALLSRAERRGVAGQRRSNVVEAGERCKGPAAGIGRWYNQSVGRGAGSGEATAGSEPDSREGGRMSDDTDQVYGPERAERLVAMLRALAERIQALDRTGQLFERVPELQKLLGNTRSELFHYEVRLTYDTPEVAESRRIVDEAERQAREARAGFDEDEDDEPWRVPGE